MKWLLWAALLAAGPKQGVNSGAVFLKHCAVCHGSDGKGNEVYEPPDFTDRQFQKSIRDSEIREAIRNGSAAMPPFRDKLSEREVKALVGRVRAFGEQRRKPKKNTTEAQRRREREE